MRLLIANRGEIARRVIRTAHRLGHETVAVFADPDADAPHVAEATMSVRIGPAPLAESYLSIDAVLAGAEATEADAVHPGYGFLAENADFARAVVDAGLVWIGPHADAIDRMGSKIEARRLATEAGVPTIPGFDESQDPDELAAAAARIGFPVLIKASAGGGGRGIRIVESADAFGPALHEASSESEMAFGDGRVIVERYVTRPRHVEVQVVGDRHGRMVHLGTRECSVQRRYQKLLEEAPAPNLPEETRAGLHESAVALSESIGYDSAGTVEFVVDDETGDHFFLEMNTRLQVEHPVTEAVTGLDLVELQLRVADGGHLDLAQDDVSFVGHAFEARITAEDAGSGFSPETGVIRRVVVPDDVRWEAAVVDGSTVSPHYDPMIAKLVVDGPDRDAARRNLARALDSLLISGVVSTTGFHRWLVEQGPVIDGRVTTRFLDETDVPSPSENAAERARRSAALAVVAAAQAPHGPWTGPARRRFTPHHTPRLVGLEDTSGEIHEIRLSAGDLAGVRLDGAELSSRIDGLRRTHTVALDPERRAVSVVVDATTFDFVERPRSARWAASTGTGRGADGALVSPFPGAVAEVHVAPGDRVDDGDVLVVLEAMKMLHPLRSPGPGTIDEVRVDVGQQVESDAVLVTFETPEEGQA